MKCKLCKGEMFNVPLPPISYLSVYLKVKIFICDSCGAICKTDARDSEVHAYINDDNKVIYFYQNIIKEIKSDG